MSALNVHTLRRKNTMQIFFFANDFRFVTCCFLHRLFAEEMRLQNL